jgi:aspartyl-tRNA(Asn)/glutamyl-tRNA(Gln) amidotransferase subunit B
MLRTLDISDANMERGEMRVEANISVSTDPDTLGTKVEVKNLNSFKSVEGAIAYEIDRQIDLLEKGDTLVQETRGWDEVKLRTFTQRVKETAKDYRYFPDPDIPKISVTESLLSEIMPILPNEKRELYSNLGLPSSQIELVIANKKLDTTFSDILKEIPSLTQDELRLAANYLTTDVVSLIDTQSSEYKLESKNFAELVKMLSTNEINSRVAKDILAELCQGSSTSPREIATSRNLLQVSDEGALDDVVTEIIKLNQQVADEYKAGKESSIQFLLGQGMKATKGSANPQMLMEAFKKALNK